MKAVELKKKYLEFFKSKGHAVIDSAPLIPEHDPTVLFTTAGMHPLIPFLIGQPHPLGKRLTDVQKCIRTQDIDEVGDESHTTFFEMLGNWSLGDYFKKEAIEMSFEFLTGKKWLNLPVERLAFSCFGGDKDAPRDEEAASIWKSLGIPSERIAFLGKEENWWESPGETGPCGPDTEMFYWLPNDVPAPKEFDPEDPNWLEIWNDVFMQYNKIGPGKYESLKQKNVDTGLGVERVAAVLQGKTNIFDIEVFKPILDKIDEITPKKRGSQEYERSFRIIADHMKAAVFILGDERGVPPSNVDQGYILRRYIRRSLRHLRLLELDLFSMDATVEIAKVILDVYGKEYPILEKKKDFIFSELKREEDKFQKTLDKGLKIAESLFSKKKPIPEEKFSKFMQTKEHVKILKTLWKRKEAGQDYSIKEANITEKEIDDAIITGEEGFLLFQSYGFPAEMIIELATEKRLFFHRAGFRKELEKHQALSRKGAEQKFKGGLSESTDMTKKLHTATHLLNEALRAVISPDIVQKGSNITPERLRFDFNFDRKLTDEEKKKIEDWVNAKIKEALSVTKEEMTVEDAKKAGAQAEFGVRYPPKVTVYSIGDTKEICMGPHVDNTSELGHFKIKKEESSAAGVRRIKAVLE